MSASIASGGKVRSHVVESFAVCHVLDAVWAATRVAEAARAHGLDHRQQHELAIVVSELVTNAVKFAGRGTVAVCRIYEPRAGVEVIVEDDGPGISEPELAVLDGYSEGAMRGPDSDPRGRRGLGSGLAAARRLSDQLVITTRPGAGTRVCARMYARGGHGK